MSAKAATQSASGSCAFSHSVKPSLCGVLGENPCVRVTLLRNVPLLVNSKQATACHCLTASICASGASPCHCAKLAIWLSADWPLGSMPFSSNSAAAAVTQGAKRCAQPKGINWLKRCKSAATASCKWSCNKSLSAPADNKGSHWSRLASMSAKIRTAERKSTSKCSTKLATAGISSINERVSIAASSYKARASSVMGGTPPKVLDQDRKSVV